MKDDQIKMRNMILIKDLINSDLQIFEVIQLLLGMKSGEIIQNMNDDTSLSSEDDEQTSKIIENDPTGRFSKYNEEIGKGAYKSVYRGYDNESGCEVAWNVVILQFILHLDEIRRARQEITILKTLKHKNIINFIHSWQSRSKRQIVFITEIVNGGSLKNYLRRITRPKLKVIKYWCRQILEGLEYMHQQNIIHRDLKCENILIDTNNNELKIGDLGLSIQMQSNNTNSVLGTPEFMAPEIYHGNYDTKVDIYAFGMCILEIVTGMKPFCECKGGTGQVIKKVMESQKPQSLEGILNEKIKSIILECLKPANERPTATQLLNQYFQSSHIDEDNSPVQLNESLLNQISHDSKNSSFFKNNLSKNISEVKGTTNNHINNNFTNQPNKLILFQECNPNSMKQSDVRHCEQQNKLSMDTADDFSIEQQFGKQYKEYYITQNDETLLDLEQRQERELQLLLTLHKQQKADLSNKLQQTNRSIIPYGSGFLSPKSFSTLFEFNNDQHQQLQGNQQQSQILKVFPVSESTNSEEIGRKPNNKEDDLNMIQSKQPCKLSTDVVVQSKVQNVRTPIQG
ncbi:unnamed protein product (macronuclear) [Paramecium tetraurelia]|uniref:Protein kinase domain-containing protein n=1 Tax=Paramecium tetraurelia TaxID=5888 RepID=A0DK70_PARTE|nr:uncharacterized protein GSPATT00017766001 [Paramecium tetraurelia]CAK83437.1 unnamed protein product [Paramecium tetraurelia]|eukprot:XP_001450834.1 hypothetical protein (macronuclear) [Paramecium tetraurelia strain d4-2]